MDLTKKYYTCLIYMSLYIIDNINKTKHLLLNIENQQTKHTIASIDKKGITKGYINLRQTGIENIMIKSQDHTILYPSIPITEENFIIYISAGSGHGKSLFASIFAKQYQHLYNQKIYFISNKKAKDDQNFRNLNIHQMSLNEINITTFKIENYRDCLFIIDDVDYGEIKKPALHVCNMVATLGREYGTSLIFISHINSKLNESVIYKEYHLYITFADNIESNKIIDRLNMKRSTINEIKELNPSFICFNKIYDYVITNNTILKMY